MILSRKIISMLLALALLLSLMPITAFATTIIASGYCGGEGNGTNLTWELTDDGVLTISGSGAMDGWNPITSSTDYQPWHGIKKQIKTVNIGDGVTNIGRCAFYFCECLTNVTIPQSVKSIDDFAFRFCTGLKTIIIPNSVTFLGYQSISRCSSLRTVVIPDSVTDVDNSVFSGCSNLREITIGIGITKITNSMFSGCDRLTDVYYSGTEQQWSKIPIGYYNDPLKNATIHYNTNLGNDSGQNAIAGFKPLCDEPIVINGKGSGKAYFRLNDSNGLPVIGKEIVANISGAEYVRTTDKNGVFSVLLPEISYDDYGDGTRNGPVDLNIDVKFYESGNPDKILSGANQTIKYQVTPAIFSQKWEGLVSGGVSLSAGLGGGAGLGGDDPNKVSIGIAELEANLLKAKLGLNVGGQLSLTYDHTATGNDLTLAFKDVFDGGFSFKSGIEGALLGTEVNVIKASEGVSLVDESGFGIKIKNYQATDLDQQLAVASFLMQSAFVGNHSVWSQKLLEKLDINQHNQSERSQKLILNTGATLMGYGTDIISEIDVGEAIFNAESTTVLGYEKLRNLLDGVTTYTASAKNDSGYGFLKGHTMLDDENIITSAGKYVWGNDHTNSLSLKAKCDSNGLSSLSYKMYLDGESDYNLDMESTDIYADVSFDATSATKIASGNSYVNDFLSENRGILTPLHMYNAIDAMAASDEIAYVTETTVKKKGINAGIGLSGQAILGGGVRIDGKFVNSTSYSHSTGIKLSNALYSISNSSLTAQDIKNQEIDLLDIMNDPLECLIKWLGYTIVSASDSLITGVTNGFSAVKGAIEGFWVEVNNIGTSASPYASYAILAVEEEYVPETDAAVAVTVGDPYSVFVYEDSSMKTLVENDALTLSSANITLSYTPEMLQTAGAPIDADLHIYWFDNSKNVYVCMSDSIQDKSAMTVSCKVSRHGEYILATDNTAPLISDFYVSDKTVTPIITAYVSDLSGIAEFSFWLDNANVLVDTDSFFEHYDPATGKFTYQVPYPLHEGTHVAYFSATDGIGNTCENPFQFSFDVDATAPQIIEVTVPTKLSSDADSFTVSAVLSDDIDIAGVTATVTTNGCTVSYPMVQNETGLWIGNVTNVAKGTTINVQVVVTDYAGNITRSENKVVIPEPSFTIAATNVSMSNNLDIMFAIPQSAVSDWTGHYAVITKEYADGRENRVDNVPFENWTTNGNYYVVTATGIAAKEMSDEITVVIYDENGNAVSYEFVQSMRNYAMTGVRKAGATALQKRLFVDMLKYGAAAQTNFGYGTDNLATALLTAEELAYGTNDTPTLEKKYTRGTYHGASNLKLESNILFQIALKNMTEGMYATVEYTGHTGTLYTKTYDATNFSVMGNYKICDVDTMVIADARQPITITVYNADGSVAGVSYESIENYCAMGGATGLPISLISYADSAYAWIHRND